MITKGANGGCAGLFRRSLQPRIPHRFGEPSSTSGRE
jgi:hypothetical protein